MKRTISTILAAFLLSLALSGCMATGGGIAPATLPITANDSYTVVQDDVYGSDWAISLFGIPLVPCSAYTALQDVKEEYDADGLINVTGENRYIYTFVINWQRMVVRGDAIKFVREGQGKIGK